MASKRSDRNRSSTPKLPRLLYHGTCLGYVDESVKKPGNYSKEIYATWSLVNAMSYAVQRADFYKDWPTLLIIGTGKIEPRYAPCLRQGQWVFPCLNLESFLILPARLNQKGQYDLFEWLRRAKSLSDQIYSLSEKEILSKNRQALASRLANIFNK